MNYKQLIGLKIAAVQKMNNGHEVLITFSNGKDLWLSSERAKQLLSELKKEMTLREYIKSLGVDIEFVDKRKTTWRLKCEVYGKYRGKTMKQACETINALKCTDCTITAEIEDYMGGWYYDIPMRRLIVRTSLSPSNIIIS